MENATQEMSRTVRRPMLWMAPILSGVGDRVRKARLEIMVQSESNSS